jgi:hypothetical protein
VVKKLLLSTIVVLIATTLLTGTALADDGTARRGGLGRVAAIDLDQSTLTVRTPRGTITVQTDESTAFRIPGVDQPTLADVRVGDLVAGTVERLDDDTLLARHIAVLRRPSRVRGWGRVQAVHGKTLVIENRQGTFEVHTDQDTVFRIRATHDPTIKDIDVGDLVAGSAVREEDGTLLAKLVIVVPPRLRPLGRVEAIRGRTLVVENRRGAFDVHTDKDTLFRIRGVEEPTIKDIEVGDLVAGRVTKQPDGTLQAKLIVVVPHREGATP